MMLFCSFIFFLFIFFFSFTRFICIHCFIFNSYLFYNTSKLRCKYVPSIVRKEKFAFVFNDFQLVSGNSVPGYFYGLSKVPVS